MSDYWNILGHEWTLNDDKKTFRIAVGLNKNLPDGLEKKFSKMLKLANRTPDLPAVPRNPQAEPMNGKPTEITIVIVAYEESKSQFDKLLQQLEMTDFAINDIHFLFIDNNTDAQEIQYVENLVNSFKRKFPNTILQRNANVGLLSGAMNKALDLIKTKLFVYLCSRHTYIYDSYWLKDLMAVMTATGVKEGKFAIGGTISYETGPHVQGGIFIAYTDPLRKIKYDVLKFPMVFMDVDICSRLIKAGYRLKEIDFVLSKMSNYTITQHRENTETKKYKIVHSHEIVEYRNTIPKNQFSKVKYSISLVCHNHVDLTKKCLESIIKHAGKRKDFEILIVDNASTDGTTHYLQDFKTRFQNNLNIQILHSETNQGFMTPQNYNAKHSCGQYLVILNNDLEVCEGWLDALEKPFLQNEKMAIVGLKQNPASISDKGSGCFGNKIEYIEMSCAMVRRDLVEKYGLFDDQLFSFGYCEDTDFSLRLREKGYDIAVVDLPIKHHRSATMGKLPIDIRGYEEKNKYFMMRRWKHYLKSKDFNYNILVKREGALGDVILLTGIVKRIKEKYPLSRLHVMTKYTDVFTNNPYVDFTYSFSEENKIPKPLDIVYDLDLSYESDPQKHIIDVYAKICNVTNEKDLYLYESTESKDKILNAYGDKKVAVFHTEPTPGWKGREMHLDRFIFAQSYLRKRGFSVVEVGTLQKRLKSDISFDNTSLKDLISIIKNAKIFVGLDSAPWHIAQAFQIPSVVPFGMITPRYRMIDAMNTNPIVVDWVTCRGCHHWQQAPTIFAATCVRDKYYCMEMITNEIVQEALNCALTEVK